MIEWKAVMKRVWPLAAAGFAVILILAFAVRTLRSRPAETGARAGPPAALGAPPRAALAGGAPGRQSAGGGAGQSSLGMIRGGTYDPPPEPAAPDPPEEPSSTQNAPAGVGDTTLVVSPMTNGQGGSPPPRQVQNPKLNSRGNQGFQPWKATAVRSKLDFGVSEQTSQALMTVQDLGAAGGSPTESLGDAAKTAPAPQAAPAGEPAPPPKKPRKFRAATARTPIIGPATFESGETDISAMGPGADGSCPGTKPWKSPKNGNCYQSDHICGAIGGMTCSLEDKATRAARGRP